MRHRPAAVARAARMLALVISATLTVASCAAVQGNGKPGRVGTAGNVSAAQFPIKGDSGTQFDQLVRNAFTDINQFWTKAFPQISGGAAFEPSSGGIYSVETNKPNPAEECMRRVPKAANNNAFYCSLDDAFAYDRTGLVKTVADSLGPNFVPLVFAHETGHLIQNRLKIDGPSISIETQADCASGAFMAAEAGAQTSSAQLTNRHFAVDPANLDGVAVGMILLRDSQPQESSSDGAHGDGFDRLSAFSDGFNKGVKYCFGSTWANRKFTERPYTNPADYSQGGNQTLAQTLSPTANLIADLNRFWTTAFKSINKTFKPVAVKQADTPPCAGGGAIRFTYCTSDNTVYYSLPAATAAYYSVPGIALGSANQVVIKDNGAGDFALGSMFAYNWGLAVRAQFGVSINDQAALLAASCYVGAYAADINVTGGREFTLSPPDMDEATITVLRTVSEPQYIGSRDTTGFQRIGAFNTGYFGTLTAC